MDFKVLENLTLWDVVIGIIDLCIVWYVFYLIITVVRGTKAIQLLKGILFILIGKVVSDILNLTTTTSIFNTLLEWGFLVIIILFQPEIRRALEQLGRGSLFRSSNVNKSTERETLVEEMMKSIKYMAKRRIGALIVFEKETGLKDYIETGIPINGKITSELLINIFIPNTPLHDGAMIIQGNEIATAASYLPLSDSPKIQKSLGTRHRAAVGISEITDAFTLVISEETGNVSVTHDGKLYKEVNYEELEVLLNKHWFGYDIVNRGEIDA
ncbi:diadenylate cyclase CdaA [Abyssicoccus albus]|jgi:diadenylate cyclase|uniref:Diadenylate cyclase n=1 Tax=Abyssicoccus albus TaxID=1817405 RepID=A0A1Q1G3G6_9BACL|nr:diadenylate cyclase CdaA [Abyssicoccus albus]AQL56779.1 TIGR00159 family protein [Abyssicoccus albus]RPF57396.1 diadenylate cyclase [Abyssicoccus albus]